MLVKLGEAGKIATCGANCCLGPSNFQSKEWKGRFIRGGAFKGGKCLNFSKKNLECLTPPGKPKIANYNCVCLGIFIII
jgi:hypothetical protein